MHVVDLSSCAIPFTHTEGCALKGSLFALAEPHTPFLAAQEQLHDRHCNRLGKHRRDGNILQDAMLPS